MTYGDRAIFASVGLILAFAAGIEAGAERAGWSIALAVGASLLSLYAFRQKP